MGSLQPDKHLFDILSSGRQLWCISAAHCKSDTTPRLSPNFFLVFVLEVNGISFARISPSTLSSFSNVLQGTGKMSLNEQVLSCIKALCVYCTLCYKIHNILHASQHGHNNVLHLSIASYIEALLWHFVKYILDLYVVKS